jgi:hypothetical protein
MERGVSEGAVYIWNVSTSTWYMTSLDDDPVGPKHVVVFYFTINSSNKYNVHLRGCKNFSAQNFC